MVLGDKYGTEFNEKVDGISKLVYTEILEFNSKVREINQVQIDMEDKQIAHEELKLADTRERTQKALDLLHAREAYQDAQA